RAASNLWVLGSFRSEENAALERLRLETRLSVTVEFRSEQSGLIRLVVPAGQLPQTTLDLHETDGWRIAAIEAHAARLEFRMSSLSDYCAYPDLAQDLVEICHHLPR
ncbi:MAG: hypothetical protein ACI9PN_002519, partial [Candidatus Azotimanducaceae bacterium]